MVKLLKNEGMADHTIQELANLVNQLKKQGKSKEEIESIISKLLDD